jgi:Rrf2 family protein
MLQLTKRTEYGLIALVHLMDHADGLAGQAPYVSAREISDRYPVPKRLLAEVLKDLARAQLIDSHRGATGGYALARRAEQISLGDVVRALEGTPNVTGCRSDDSSCEIEPVCPIKNPMSRVRTGIWELMERTSLRDLASNREPEPPRLLVKPKSQSFNPFRAVGP